MLQASRIEYAGLYTEQAPIPLQGVDIDVQVLDVASEVTIRQRFKNIEPAPVEALYCFPIEEGAAVYRFEARIGERSIKAEIEERDTAFQKYDEALARGDGAFLLDQEKADIFVASVGSLLPGQEVEVSICYVAELPVSDDQIHLIIPTTVSPRYVPEGYDPLKADVISPPTQPAVPYRLGLRVAVHDARGLSDISSPSHSVEISASDDVWTVTLKDAAACLDRDFILDIRHTNPKAPRAIMQQHENGDRAVMLRLYPEFESKKTAGPSEIIFVLDCSGSMGGSSIEQARRVIEMCLRSMSYGDFFNVVRFGSRFESLFPASTAYSDTSFKKAQNYIRTIAADLGGTELVPALRSVLTLPPAASGHRSVFVITDGQIANEEEAVALAWQHRPTTRIYTFGIGYGASMSLVKGLARASGAMAEFVSPDERIEDKVLRQFARFDSPCLRDLRVNWNGAGVRQAPAIIPPVFSGDSFTLYALLESGSPGSSIELCATADSGSLRFCAPVADAGAGSMIALLWAKHAIRDLESNAEPGSQQLERKAQAVAGRIVELSKRYQILSGRTSFVGIETRSDAEKAACPPVCRRVPVQLTRGWHDSERVVIRCCMEDYGADGHVHHRAVIRKRASALYICRCFDEAPVFTKHPSEPHELLQPLLLTQMPSGCFDLTDALSAYLNASIDDLRSMAERITGVNPHEDKRQVLATAFVMLILKRRKVYWSQIWPETSKKVQAWLDAQARNAELDGRPLDESLWDLFGNRALT